MQKPTKPSLSFPPSGDGRKLQVRGRLRALPPSPLPPRPPSVSPGRVPPSVYLPSLLLLVLVFLFLLLLRVFFLFPVHLFGRLHPLGHRHCDECRSFELCADAADTQHRVRGVSCPLRQDRGRLPDSAQGQYYSPRRLVEPLVLCVMLTLWAVLRCHGSCCVVLCYVV